MSTLASPESRKRLVWLLAVGAISVALLSAGALIVIVRPPSGSVTQPPAEPPVLATVPAFEAHAQDGSTFSAESLRGHIWVANFVFTRCPNVCPSFTAKMSGLQMVSARRLPQLKLVSFTVDPDYDSPEQLKTYGQKYQADFSRWSFVNAPKDVLEQTLTRGMLVPLERGDAGDLNAIMHSSYFVLVDRALKVRGFYRFSEANSIEAVMRDAEALARAP